MTDEESATSRLRIAVIASGSGTTLQAVIDACNEGILDGEIALVISNNSHSGAMGRAVRHKIPSVHLSSRTHGDPKALDRAIADNLAESSPDVVLLAGYMKKLGPEVLEAYRGRVINTHPSLLPKFGGPGMYGNHVHSAVIDACEPVTGISVHLVDGEYDTGRVLAQRKVRVESSDDAKSLASRVQSVERPFLIEVLQGIATAKVQLG